MYLETFNESLTAFENFQNSEKKSNVFLQALCCDFSGYEDKESQFPFLSLSEIKTPFVYYPQSTNLGKKSSQLSILDDIIHPYDAIQRK